MVFVVYLYRKVGFNMWVKVNTYRKRAEININGSGVHGVNLREHYDGINWENERGFMTMNNFAFNSFFNSGNCIFACNPKGNNYYEVFNCYVRANSQDSNFGLLQWSGNQYNPTIQNNLYSGNIFAFSFMLEFLSKNNGITNNCGIEVFIDNYIVARHYISGNSQYLQNFVVGGVYTENKAGTLGFRPVGNLNFKRGYENVIIHYFKVYTQPIVLLGGNIGNTIWFLEGDI